MEKSNDNIKEEVKDFIIKNYLSGNKKVRLIESDSFLEKGIIDSIGVIELTSFIQKTYNIKIEVAEIIPENFDTLNNLELYIIKKLDKR